MSETQNHTTDTSKWSLVIHRVSTNSVEVWVGTLFPTMNKPLRARVRLAHPDGRTTTQYIERSEWKRPFRQTKQRFFALVEFTGLQPNGGYQLAFDRRVEATAGLIREEWQNLRNGSFETLPLRVPTKRQRPLTIAIGSCFYDHRDGGQASEAYQALYDRGPDSTKPLFTILTGDQVYIDIGFDSLSRDADEIRQRIGDDYAQHWRSLGGILNRGGTWMLPDDHEYWNDYPFYDSPIPQLLALKLKRVREAWNRAATDGVRCIQRSPSVETISFGNDLSICMADLRSRRSATGFLPPAQFRKLVAWAEGLRSPGVLAIPQPLIVEENKMERNLLSYGDQYARLLEALASSGHDIVVLSGDVHFGRIATCALGNNGGRLIEIISSPLSNLTFLNGIASAKATHKPTRFPDASIQIDGWVRAKVDYSKNFDVKTKRGFLFSAHPKERTREHFMTIGFQRMAAGRIRLSAQAWRVRSSSGPKNLPTKDFDRQYRVTLR